MLTVNDKQNVAANSVVAPGRGRETGVATAAPKQRKKRRGSAMRLTTEPDLADRAWFAVHPKRRWRLREPMQGETGAFASAVDMLAAAGVRFAIAVFQPAPGTHDRHRVGLRTRDPFDSFTDAGILALVPELAAIDAGGDAP
jgi:hypothetical protein